MRRSTERRSPGSRHQEHGFDFRTSADVRFKQIFLDAYYQLDTFLEKQAALQARGLTVSDEQTILYDDVVVATERIGCRVTPP